MTGASLRAGMRLGPYEVECLLGAGGMGEVYRARDTRLERTVAIKVLIGDAPADHLRRERFAVEARALSALSHPHIRTLYDVGSAEGVDFLVMEYVEGRTLASYLRGRPVDFEHALAWAAQLADAVAAAHRAGIVHCDIKPANIMVTATGIKLLDFGVARLWSDLHAAGAITATASSGLDGSHSYMAPERLEGGACDARGDVYSCGVVLFEMFAGRKPVVGAPGAEWPVGREQMPPIVSGPLPELQHVIARCLARSPADRWQAAGDLAGALRWIAERSRSVITPPARRRARGVVAGLAIVLAASGAAYLSGTSSRAHDEKDAVVRFLVEPVAGSTMSVNPGAFVVSPDGHRIVFTASSPGGKRLLWLRSLDANTAEPIPGTDDAWNPFWRGDSRRVAFIAGRFLRTVDVVSGALVTIGQLPAAASRAASGSWNSDDDIILAAGSELLHLSASSGTITPLRFHDTAGPVQYAVPAFLPDGHRFLYHVRTDSKQTSGLYLAGLTDSGARRVVESDSQAAYVVPGYLLFVKGGALVAQRVDPDTLVPRGLPVALAEGVSLFGTFNQAAFSASFGNILAYRPGTIATELRWFDRTGRSLGVVAPPAPYANPALSPDGDRVAVTRFDPGVGTSDLYLVDGRGAMTRLTTSPAVEDNATWSPDGRRLAFTSNEAGATELLLAESANDPASTASPVHADGRNKLPFQWSGARDVLLFLAADVGGLLNGTFRVRHADGNASEAVQGAHGNREEGQPQISPDGRWLAYVGDVTGSPHVFVRPFPRGTGRSLISPAGGFEPRWRADGRELFFLAPDRTLMAVDVDGHGASFVSSEPRPLFRTNLAGSYLGSSFPGNRIRNEYDVAADGQRFLINDPVEGATAFSVRVVVNWKALLQQ